MPLENESRPRLARLLKLDKLQENKKALAAYVGFNMIPQLHYFCIFRTSVLKPAVSS